MKFVAKNISNGRWMKIHCTDEVSKEDSTFEVEHFRPHDVGDDFNYCYQCGTFPNGPHTCTKEFYSLLDLYLHFTNFIDIQESQKQSEKIMQAIERKEIIITNEKTVEGMQVKREGNFISISLYDFIIDYKFIKQLRT